MPFLDIYYTILLMISRNRSKEKKKEHKYYLSVCVIFRDEELSLQEWIEYHLLIGVDHFYMYNNLSTDNFQPILQPYIQSGIIDLIEWPVQSPSQFSAYEDCYGKYREDSQWIAFIDIDEYICPYYKVSIKDWIKGYEQYSSIVMYWKMFGTSGLLEHDMSKLVAEQYIGCWDKFYDVGKVIFNTNFEVYKFSEHHVMSAKVKILKHVLSIPPINEFKNFIRYKCNRIGMFRTTEDFTIQINHYWSKSYDQYFIDKVLRGDPAAKPKQSTIRTVDAFFWHEHHNKACDYKIWRFLIELKIRMGKARQIQEKIKMAHESS